MNILKIFYLKYFLYLLPIGIGTVLPNNGFGASTIYALEGYEETLQG